MRKQKEPDEEEERGEEGKKRRMLRRKEGQTRIHKEQGEGEQSKANLIAFY